MPVTTPGLTIDNLTLSVSQEIHVRSSLTATFAALLEQMGPSNETPDMKMRRWTTVNSYSSISSKRPATLLAGGRLALSVLQRRSSK